ncbi:transketolase [Pilibacter termitis]|uniref:Transketolase n=1 Tax=Pilibacter termitis TaxID=263852 RepID=A0A1T4Q6V8_9ENTE|nr:transketolase [Pilibacter termitis]SJZ99297.1 transketolase [Pilibacter termitis]
MEKLRDTIRLDVLKTLKTMGYGHLGGALSIVELLAALYGSEMKFDAKNPSWEERDRLVLSKGHAGIALYATLANAGFFPKDWLDTVNVGGTNLPSHPDRLKTAGVDVTTGSLGQGTSIAAGIAYGLKMKKSSAFTYLICGDGELNEGQCWEAFQFIAHNQLDNCLVIIDENKKQLDGRTKDILNPFDIQEKMRAFGFTTQKVDGSDLSSIQKAIHELKQVKNSAIALVLDTTKGQGIPYFEELSDNHSVKFDNEENRLALEKAIEELEVRINEQTNE